MSLRGYLFERPLIEDLGPPARRLSRRVYQRYLALALAIAAAFHLAVGLGGWGVREILARQSEGQGTKQVRIVPYREIGAPPSLQQKPFEPPKFALPPPKLKAPPTGIPVPVPKEEAPSTTIASQTQIPFAGTKGDTGLGDTTFAGSPYGTENGTGLEIDDVLPSPDDFVPVEEQPVLVEMKPPEYPSLAREAGIEGTVIVRALVAKDGRVKDVLLGKGVNVVLDEAALAAARQCVFKPAIQNKNPVAVWVAIPFRFSLQD